MSRVVTRREQRVSGGVLDCGDQVVPGGRQGPDAERLQGKAQEARQCAAQEVCGL
jgi:hypothetical protein